MTSSEAETLNLDESMEPTTTKENIQEHQNENEPSITTITSCESKTSHTNTDTKAMGIEKPIDDRSHATSLIALDSSDGSSAGSGLDSGGNGGDGGSSPSTTAVEDVEQGSSSSAAAPAAGGRNDDADDVNPPPSSILLATASSSSSSSSGTSLSLSSSNRPPRNPSGNGEQQQQQQLSTSNHIEGTGNLSSNLKDRKNTGNAEDLGTMGKQQARSGSRCSGGSTTSATTTTSVERSVLRSQNPEFQARRDRILQERQYRRQCLSNGPSIRSTDSGDTSTTSDELGKSIACASSRPKSVEYRRSSRRSTTTEETGRSGGGGETGNVRRRTRDTTSRPKPGVGVENPTRPVVVGQEKEEEPLATDTAAAMMMTPKATGKKTIEREDDDGTIDPVSPRTPEEMSRHPVYVSILPFAPFGTNREGFIDAMDAMSRDDNTTTSKLEELRASKTERESQLRMMFHDSPRSKATLVPALAGNKVPHLVEPEVYMDLKEELVGAYKVIELQKEQLRNQWRETVKPIPPPLVDDTVRDDSNSDETTDNKEGDSNVKDDCKDDDDAADNKESSDSSSDNKESSTRTNTSSTAAEDKVAELEAKILQMQHEYAFRELHLLSKITDSSQEYKATIEYFRKQTICWRDRFESSWNDHEQVIQQLQSEKTILEKRATKAEQSLAAFQIGNDETLVELVRAKARVHDLEQEIKTMQEGETSSDTSRYGISTSWHGFRSSSSDNNNNIAGGSFHGGSFHGFRSGHNQDTPAGPTIAEEEEFVPQSETPAIQASFIADAMKKSGTTPRNGIMSIFSPWRHRQ